MFITNIQRFSLDDGPGIRTTIFFAGCNMKCCWCHNPETLQKNMLGYDLNKCIGCRKCMNYCKKKVHVFTDNIHYLKNERCDNCLECIKGCEEGALFRNTKEIEVEQVLLEIEKDKRFFEKSHGGVTFSGGEPLLQAQALEQLLKVCKRNGIDTAVETAGKYEFKLLEPLLDDIDLVIIDCKAFSEKIHLECTGESNHQILENIQMLSDKNKRFWIRIPVVWNVNITLDEMEKIAKFLEEKNMERVELLPYHKMGISKYKVYNMEYSLYDVEPPTKEQMECLYEILEGHKIPVNI